uniref:NADH dehydrogenase subunit 2 n=1 Tax=Vaginularia trichoidea TaxID=474354 RepID=A0A3G5CT76_9MONI|nr:NADH dehydrogenase subunit 2 [Vaginularia trichoidea]AYW16052.1 NADH dehydrogenase subunit 2 [Vaginularia trichoidea]
MNNIILSFLRLVSISIDFTILPEIIVIFSLILIIVIDLFTKGKNTTFLYSISMLSLLLSLFLLFYQWSGFSSSKDLYLVHFSTIFRVLILFCSLLSLLLSIDYVICSKTPLAEFLLFNLSANLAGMILTYANDLITIYISLEFLAISSCFYLVMLNGIRDRMKQVRNFYWLVERVLLLYFMVFLSYMVFLEVNLNLIKQLISFTTLTQALYFMCQLLLLQRGFLLNYPFFLFTNGPLMFMKESPTPVVAFFSVTSKVAALASFTRLFGIIFPHLPSEWHIAVGLLATFSMILGNLIAVAQRSVKRMLAYPSISQIGYIMIGVLAADSGNGYASMITYTFLYILMNLGTFARITPFGLRTGTDNIRDYAGLYMKDPVLTFSPVLRSPSLGGMPPLSGFFGKLHLFWHGWKAGSYPSVLAALVASVISIYYYLKIIKSMFTGKSGKSGTPITSRQNPLTSPSISISKNSLEIAMIIRALASTLSGILIDPMIQITRKTFF